MSLIIILKCTLNWITYSHDNKKGKVKRGKSLPSKIIQSFKI